MEASQEMEPTFFSSLVLEVLLAPLGLLVLGIVLTVAFLYYKFAYAPFQAFKGTGIKGPTPSVFYGNYKDRAKMGFLKFSEELYKQYGPIVGYYHGQLPQLLVLDIDLIKQITVKDFDSFMDRPPFPDLLRKDKGAPRGLLTSNGDVWRTSRQTLTPTFSSAKMRMMVPMIRNSIDVLTEIFQEKADTDNSFEFFKTFGSFTMETVLATAFGRVIDLQKGESDQLSKAAESIFRGSEEGRTSSIVFLLVILSNFPWMENVLRLLVGRTRRRDMFYLLQNTAIKLVKARRAENSSGKYKDLLQLMLDASIDEGDDEEERKGNRANKMSDEQIVSHSVTFMLAGYETTANTLAYTSYLLALNPNIQEKLQAEIDKYYSTKPDASHYQAAQEIKYLDMVIQESLRLYPPVPRFNRYCNKQVKFKNITIPKGVSVAIPSFLLQKSPDYWTDPEEFNPDRFTDEEKAKRPPQCHMPFGAGPRSCIGMRFALLEAKLALIELLKRFTFLQAPDTEIPLQTVLGITMAPKNGIYLRVASRI